MCVKSRSVDTWSLAAMVQRGFLPYNDNACVWSHFYVSGTVLSMLNE